MLFDLAGDAVDFRLDQVGARGHGPVGAKQKLRNQTDRGFG